MRNCKIEYVDGKWIVIFFINDLNIQYCATSNYNDIGSLVSNWIINMVLPY